MLNNLYCKLDAMREPGRFLTVIALIVFLVILFNFGGAAGQLFSIVMIAAMIVTRLGHNRRNRQNRRDRKDETD